MELVRWARYIHSDHAHTILRGLFRISWRVGSMQLECGAERSVPDRQGFDIDPHLAVLEEFGFPLLQAVALDIFQSALLHPVRAVQAVQGRGRAVVRVPGNLIPSFLQP